MPAKHTPETGTRNLHVYRSIRYQFLVRNGTQLYSIAETVRHMTRTVQRDWPLSCFGARNCGELASNFLCKYTVTSFWCVCRRHYSCPNDNSDVAKWSLRVVYLTVAFPLLTVTHSFVSAVSGTRFTT